MKRKDWSSPRTSLQEFAPQEFVAVCQDRDTWGATCVTMDSHQRGYIFYDHNMNGILDEEDLISRGRSEHGGCGRTHYFHSPTRPSFNGWVLSEDRIVGNLNNYLTSVSGGNYKLTQRGIDALRPALIREPGDVFDNNWLVCINLDDLRNPS